MSHGLQVVSNICVGNSIDLCRCDQPIHCTTSQIADSSQAPILSNFLTRHRLKHTTFPQKPTLEC